MRTSHSLICFVLLALQDGQFGRINAESIHEGEEGGSITVGCSFTVRGQTSLFCRETCDGGNILIETTRYSARNGRYSFEYEEGSLITDHILYVTINQLKMSDSGRYRCLLKRPLFPDSSYDFRIQVRKARTTPAPKQTQKPPTSTSRPADAATSTCSYSSSNSSSSPQPTAHLENSGWLLVCAGVILAVLIIVLSAVLLIFYKKRSAAKHKGILGPPVEAEYSDVTAVSQLYEEIREDRRQNVSPPVAISTVYACASFSKSSEAKGTDDYSLITYPQSKVDSSDLPYSEVVFPKDAAASLHSAPSGGASPPLYATVARHQ